MAGRCSGCVVQVSVGRACAVGGQLMAVAGVEHVARGGLRGAWASMRHACNRSAVHNPDMPSASTQQA